MNEQGQQGGARVVAVDQHHAEGKSEAESLEEPIIRQAGGTLVRAGCRGERDLIDAVAEADVVLFTASRITEPVIAAMRRCRGIIRYGIGLDGIDLDAARRHNIPVCNAPDFCIDEMADHTLALALALGRGLPGYDRRLRRGGTGVAAGGILRPFRGSVFATVGFGRIARAVLERARAFGFRLAACDPHLPAENFEAAGVAAMPLEDLVREADILSLHCPLVPETRGLLDAARLRSMKPEAIVINTARGGLIDSDALAGALQAGCPAAAGLDVTDPEPLPPDHPLLACENVLLTPHVGWYSGESRRRLRLCVAEEAARMLRGEPLKNRVV